MPRKSEKYRDGTSDPMMLKYLEQMNRPAKVDVFSKVIMWASIVLALALCGVVVKHGIDGAYDAITNPHMEGFD